MVTKSLITKSSSGRDPEAAGTPSRGEREALRAFSLRVRDDYEARLKELVELPTVSADPAHRRDIERAAELAVATIRRFGGEARVIPTGGNPLVYGVFDAGKGLPTVTVYNHLDVQPASRETEPWRTDPFTLVRKGDRYFGRGTTDDKGPALAALFGLRAAREAGAAVNVRLLWELEEEIGSPHFEETIARHAGALATDAVVVSDTVWVSRTRPAIPSSLRGFQGFRFVLTTGDGDAHSGEVGGAARNPVGELMQLMCDLHDARTGRVKIPGFNDDVVEPTGAELADFGRCGFSLGRFKKDLRLRSLRVERPLEVLRRIWALPTFEVHGVVGGYAGPGLKAIVPGQAEVKASCRLVPRQTPAKVAAMVKAFVKRRHPDVVVHLGAAAHPYEGLASGPLAAALRDSIRFAFGREPALVRDGGSIGAVDSMRRVLRAPILFLGLSLPADGYHAPNESFAWGQASGGMAAFARLLLELSRARPVKAPPARARRAR